MVGVYRSDLPKVTSHDVDHAQVRMYQLLLLEASNAAELRHRFRMYTDAATVNRSQTRMFIVIDKI